MTTARHFAFHSAWQVAAPPGPVVDVLADVERYPCWWPQVRSVRSLGEDRGDGVVRSLLPVPLHLMLTREVEDRGAGVLRVRLTGDLEGAAEFRVSAATDGANVDFRQSVRLAHVHLITLPRAFDPVLRANHAWMMRGCRRGLARTLGVPGR